ncbi:MAG TPA: hypothetical protein PLT66_00265 [Bacillota bacterium]|nr:hypothetical protein [Bacillota bacterium]
MTIIIASFLFAVIPTYAYQLTSDETCETEVNNNMKSFPENLNYNLTDEEIPEVLNGIIKDTSNHISRLYELEDLSTVVYQNIDGTMTMYMFDEPIKYVDSNNQYKDKTTKLVQTENGYALKQNSAIYSYNVSHSRYIISVN